MTFLAVRFGIASLLMAAFFYLPCGQAGAASSSENKSVVSSGLKASIGRIATLSQGPEKKIAIQLILENTTNERIYLFVVGDQKASLSDGHSLVLREVVGLPYCRFLYPQEQITQMCLDRYGKDLEYYSYLDSGGIADLSLMYFVERAPGKYTPSGSISFRLILVTRVAHAPPNSFDVQADPKKITNPQMVILRFPLTPLQRD